MWNDQSSGCNIVLVLRCVTWTQEIKVCKRCVSGSWSLLRVQRTNSCVASSSSQLWRLLAPGNVGVSQALPPVFRARGLLPSVYCLDPSRDLRKLLTKQNLVPRYQAVYCLPLFCVSFLVDAASCTSQFCFIVLQHVCAHKHTHKRYLPAISLFSSKHEKVCSTANKGEAVAHDTGKLERACFQMNHGMSLNPTVSPEDLYFMISIHPPCFLREFVLLI